MDTSSKDICDISTKVKKEVWIESEVLGLRSAIRKFGMDRYKRNYIKAASGFEYVLKNQFTWDGRMINHAMNNNKLQTVSNCASGNRGIDVSTNMKMTPYTKLGSSQEHV